MAGEGGAPQDDGRDGGRAQSESGKATDAGDQRADGRPDPLAGARDDPFAEAVGSTASESADQFYRNWKQTITAGGNAAYVGGSVRDLSVGNTIIYSYASSAHPPGQVRQDVLDRLRVRYARVDGYDAMLDQLTSKRLIALRGAPGTGRTATALSLLNDVAESGISRFSPEHDVHSLLDAELEQDSGYLLELVPGWNRNAPLAMQVDRVCQHVTDSESFLVLIAPHDLRYQDALEGYVVDCPLPDPKTVLELAIDDEIAKRPELERSPLRLSAHAQLAESGARLPSEVAWLVALLVSHAAGETSLADVTGRRGESLSFYVSGWFDPLANIPASSAADEQVRLATFRIALAVFNQTPFDLVAEAGELLAEQILTAGAPRRKPGRAVFASHREDYVADSRARLVPGIMRFGESDAPSTFAEYIDERMPTAVLRHVWDVHNIRGPLISWLQSFAHDKRPYVWMQAALSLGLLASWDFPYSFHEHIDPWAGAGDARLRLVAAVALDAAAGNGDISTVIREILGGWRKNGTENQRWTCATALGYDLGLVDPKRSLRDLQAIGCWEDGTLAPVASWAVARIFARGGIQPVLNALDGWLGDDRLLVRELALRAVLNIIDLKAADLEDPEISGAVGGLRGENLRSRDRWPLLIAIAEEDKALLDPLADLVWRVSRSAAAQQPARQILAGWIRAAEKDRSSLGPLARFLALLGDDDSDRARLTHLVRTMSRDPDEPLPADLADLLIRAIEENIIIINRQEHLDDDIVSTHGGERITSTPAPSGNSHRQ